MPRKHFLNYAVYVDQYIKTGRPSYDGSMTCYGCVDDLNNNGTASHSHINIQLQPFPRKYFWPYGVYVDQCIKIGLISNDRPMNCYGCVNDLNKNATASHYLICIQLQPMPRKYFLNCAVYVDQYIKNCRPSYDGSMTCYGSVVDLIKNATASHSLICKQSQPMPREYFLTYAVFVDQWIKTGHPSYDMPITCYGCVDDLNVYVAASHSHIYIKLQPFP